MQNNLLKTRILVILATFGIVSVFFGSALFVQEYGEFFYKKTINEAGATSLFVGKNLNQSNSVLGQAVGVPVLLYHGIVEKSDRFNITQEKFAEHMIALHEAGYRTIIPDEFLGFLNAGLPLPEKSFLLTFDDGRKDSYYGTDPILRRLGFEAVMFIASAQSIDKTKSDYYLTLPELKAMLDSSRWFIESHASQVHGGQVVINEAGELGNVLSNKMWLPSEKRIETDEEYKTRITSEFAESHESIKNNLGVTPKLFSYPFSDYGQQSLNNLNLAEGFLTQTALEYYTGAFRQIWPVDHGYLYNLPETARAKLKRYEPSPSMSGDALVNLLENSAPKDLPLVDDFTREKGWKSSWGKHETNDEHLLLSPSADGEGAFVFLDGSFLWQDYYASAEFKKVEKSNLSVIARMVDEDNFVKCNYISGKVSIDAVVSGKTHKLANVSKTFLPENADYSFGIAVSGGEIFCILNNQIVASTQASADMMRSHGGVAIGMWGKGMNLSVDDFHAIPIEGSIGETLLQSKARPIKTIDGYENSQEGPVPIFPEYRANQVDAVLSNPKTFFEIKNKKSENLVLNTEFAFETDSINIAKWGESTYGNIEALFSVGTKDILYRSLDVKVLRATGLAEANWYFDPIDVNAGEEYSISGIYTSNAPVLFVAEYKMQDGSYQKERINWLVPTPHKTKVSGSVLVPEGAVSMTAYFALRSPGELSMYSVEVYALDDGKFASGMVTLNFDDGYKSTYRNATELLVKNNIPATHFIISDFIGEVGYMDSLDLALLYKKKMEIGAHTRTHRRLTTLSLTEMEGEIKNSKSKLEQYGFPVKVFDYPYGSVNNLVRAQVVNAGYLGARTVLRGFNTKNTDPYMLRDQYVGQGTSLAEVREMIDEAMRSRTWLILEFHDIVDSGEEGSGESADLVLLKQTIDYLKLKKAEIISLEEGIKRMK